jgi:hypothetical protein
MIRSFHLGWNKVRTPKLARCAAARIHAVSETSAGWADGEKES